jgi:hypothetical protein
MGDILASFPAIAWSSAGKLEASLARLLLYPSSGATEKGDAMKKIATLCLLVLAGAVTAAAPAAAAKCEMKFVMKGWAAFYKTASGSGTITCDNGQTATVNLNARGGGLEAGKSRIDDGTGKFSEVSDIRELFGTYVSGSASAGAGKSAEAGVVTKGDISLALAGHGSGIELGVSFGKFTISRR